MATDGIVTDNGADLPIRVVRIGSLKEVPLKSGRGGSIQLLHPQPAAPIDAHIIALDVDGDRGSVHEHTRSHNVLLVLEGSVEVETAVQTIRLESQDLIAIPPATAHSVSVVGEVPARLLEIYTPAPADFVPAELDGVTAPAIVFAPEE